MEEKFNHKVYMNFKDETTKEEIEQMFLEMKNLEYKIPQIISIQINNHICNLNGKYYDGMFNVIFRNRKTEQEYQKDPEHEKVSKIIQKISKDIEVKDYLN